MSILKENKDALKEGDLLKISNKEIIVISCQHDLTARIYVLNKITTALKFTSNINW